MPYCIMLILAVNQTGDTLAQIPSRETPRSYNKEIIINGSVGLGFGIAAGAFYLLGNKAYENYQRCGSMKAANDYYQQAVTYDHARNVLFAGAVFFLGRAVYYQFKSSRSAKTSGLKPRLEIAMPEYAKVQLGFKRGL